MSAEITNLSFIPVHELGEIPEHHMQQAINVYQRAFENPPYCELFSSDEAKSALQFILDKDGDLILGTTNDRIISLAGGYFNEPREYFVEELAVDPDVQGKGFGRGTLRFLIDKAKDQDAETLELCTHSDNDKAIRLYQSEGFTLDAITKAALHPRVDGEIKYDTRIYLTKENSGELKMNREKRLKRVAIMYPSGNTTAVVFDQLLDSDRQDLNSKIMESWKSSHPNSPEIEQCCFVTKAQDPSAITRVEMFGGEFCGNATRSVIQIITGGNDYKGKIEVSGVDKPLNFSVVNSIIKLEMPLPKDKKMTQVVEEGMLVTLDGISHLVVVEEKTKNIQTPRKLLQQLLKNNKYNLTNEPAVGVSYYDQQSKKADFAVWVKEVDTIFDETACGSGTCSIGITLAKTTNGDVELDVIQPSGESIKTSASYDKTKDAINDSTISGEVSLLYDDRFKLA